jgi:hypothetical protein
MVVPNGTVSEPYTWISKFSCAAARDGRRTEEIRRITMATVVGMASCRFTRRV